MFVCNRKAVQPTTINNFLSFGKGASISRFVDQSVRLSVHLSEKFLTQILAFVVQKGVSLNELKCWNYLLIQGVSLQLHPELIVYHACFADTTYKTPLSSLSQLAETSCS